MQAKSVTVALGAAVVLITGPARAEPDDLVSRPLVLDRNTFDLRLTMAMNVQPRTAGRPMTLAPDAWWGITPRVTIGIIHSDASLDQIATSASFCVRESENSTCDRMYHGSGIDVRVAVMSGEFAIAPRARLLIRDLDPFKPAVTLGSMLRWTRGRFAITSDPYLRLPLANGALGNRSAMMLPLWLAVQPAAGWALALHTGVASDLAVMRDGWHPLFAVDVTARITGELDVGAEAGWGSLFGPQADPKRATIMVAAAWRG